MKKRNWVAFFSQTGAEIADLSEKLGYWPDTIVTNERPDHVRKIDDRIFGSSKIVYTSNKPNAMVYKYILDFYKKPVVTLHGWLRIVPPEICEKYEIYNGHPGLITKYPELKGKDPQIRAFEGNYKTIGAVIHKVTPGVDEGKVLLEEEVNAFGLEIDDVFHILRDRSLYMWVNLLKNIL